jgi:hypothetical protein
VLTRIVSGVLIVSATLLESASLNCQTSHALPAEVTAPGVAFSGTCAVLTFDSFQVIGSEDNPNPEAFLYGMSFDPDRVFLAFIGKTLDPLEHGPQDMTVFFTVHGPLYGIKAQIGGTNASIITEVACSSTMTPESPVCPEGNVLGTLSNISIQSVLDGTPNAIQFDHRSDVTYISKVITVSDINPDPGGRDQAIFHETFTFTTPEPASFVIAGLGIVGIIFARRKLHRP